MLKVLWIWNKVGMYSLNFTISLVSFIFRVSSFIIAFHSSCRAIYSLSKNRYGHFIGLFLPYFYCIFLINLSQFSIIFFLIFSLLKQ